MSRIPIPEDWTEETDGWTQFVVCVPNSTQWRALFRGAVYNLTRGRKWDEDTGIIKDAQAIAWRIYDSMQNCTDNLKVTRMLVAAILGEQVDLTDPAQLTPDAVNYTAGGGLPGLVPTLAALNLSPVTNVASPTVNVDCGGGCGCEPGTDPPPTGGVEGDPPPEGWGEPTDPDTGEPIAPGSPAYQDRKCKAANLLHDGIRELVYQLNIYGVDNLSSLGVGIATGVVTAIITTTIVGPASLIVGIVTGIAAMVLVFTSGAIELSTLVTLLDDNQEDLVCALYNSQSADQAISDYTDVLSTAGANTLMVELIQAILTYATANALFFKKDGADGDQVEQDIEDYVGGVDCSMCAVLQVVAVGNGQLGGAGHVGFPVDVGETIVLNSVLDPDNGFYYAQVKPSTNSPCFAFTMRLISFSNPSYPTPTGDGRYLDDCSGNFDYYNDLTPLIGTTFSTSHFFAVSFDPGLQFEFELISIP